MEAEEVQDVILKIVNADECSYICMGNIKGKKLEDLYKQGKIDLEDIRRLLSIFIDDVKIIAFKDPETNAEVILFVNGKNSTKEVE